VSHLATQHNGHDTGNYILNYFPRARLGIIFPHIQRKKCMVNYTSVVSPKFPWLPTRYLIHASKCSDVVSLTLVLAKVSCSCKSLLHYYLSFSI
jgi:hypothetical protein